MSKGHCFDIDLEYGEGREDAAAAILRRARVEVKSDRKAHKTGNVFVEIRQGSTKPRAGRPSGISVTEAEYWMFEVLPDRWILLRTSALKYLVELWVIMHGTVMGGDSRRFEGVLIPVAALVTGRAIPSSHRLVRRTPVETRPPAAA